MTFFANPQVDLPQPWKQKRIIFYAQGLKIYGQIPYILQRRLQAEFFSNDMTFMGGRLCGPSFENNYTLIRYHRAKDGKRHSDTALETLLDWLYADKGFEWAIAKDFFKQIDLPNFWNWPPETFILGGTEHRPNIKQLMLESPKEVQDETLDER